MKEKIKNQSPPKLDKEPGKPGFEHGNTGLPQQQVETIDEDVKAEQDHEKTTQPKQNTDDETRKIVNEQEQDQVVNNDEPATETKPAKMSDKKS